VDLRCRGLDEHSVAAVPEQVRRHLLCTFVPRAGWLAADDVRDMAQWGCGGTFCVDGV